MTALLLAATLIALAALIGFYVKWQRAEASRDEWIGSHAALEAKYHQLATRLARQVKATDTANDAADRQRAMAHRHRERAADLERLLVAERARTEIHETNHACLPTLNGIAANGVTAPVGEVVADEPTWVGLVREVADVVPLRKGGAK